MPAPRVMARAPAARVIRIAASPTLLLAAVITTEVSYFSRPNSTSAPKAVRCCIQIAAPSVADRFSG